MPFGDQVFISAFEGHAVEAPHAHEVAPTRDDVVFADQ
jgi:hypothetical protein